MEQITLRVEAETKESLESEAEDAGKNLSEYIRNILESRNEHTSDDSELQERVEQLQQRVDELREEREDLIRDSVRVEYLENELERVRTERDEALKRAERNETKLKLHSSEKGLLSRIRDKIR